MKNLTFTLLFLLLSVFALEAQNTPQGFNYQGVARENNTPIVGDISLQISIRENTTQGPIIYQERQFPVTNAQGIFSIEVGGIQAVVTQGNFEMIDWSTGDYFLNVQLDQEGGTNFTNMGTSKLVSVPYALFAEQAQTALTAMDDMDTDPANEIQNLELDGTTITISDGNSIDLTSVIPPGGTDDQNLTLDGDQLSIEGGNTVDLSGLGGSGGTDDQTLTLDNTTLTLENGGSVDLSVIQDGTEDADSDPSNELQTLSLDGNIIQIENGNSVDLSAIIPLEEDDNQNLTLLGTTITIEDGNTIDLASIIPPGGTDDQVLELTGTDLSIEGGNTVDLSAIAGSGGTDDQTLALNGTDLTIEGGNTLDLSALAGTDDQSLTLSNTILTLENGGSVDLSVVQDGTEDADADPMNEMQNLELTGTTIFDWNGLNY